MQMKPLTPNNSTLSSAHVIKLFLLIFVAEVLILSLMLLISGDKSLDVHLYHVGVILTISLTTALLLVWAVVRSLHRVSQPDVNERNETLIMLENKVSNLRSMLESTSDGIIVVDRNLRISDYNQKYLDMWAIPQEVIETFDAYEVFYHISPLLDDPDWFKARSIEVYTDDLQDTIDVVRLNDGRVFERLSQPQKIDGEVVGRVSNYRDVTERVSSMQALLDSEARFRKIFEELDNAQFIFDSELKTTIDLNSAACRLFKCEKDQLVRKPPEFFFSPADFKRILHQQREQGNSKIFQIESMKLSLADGSEIYISAHGRNINLNGRSAMLCTFVDITEKNIMDRQARDIEAKLIQANKMNSLGVLVTGIAHEINNPNNYIMLNSELVSNAWKDIRAILEDYYEKNGQFSMGGIPYTSSRDEIQGLLDSIIEGSNRIKDIINTLKEFAKDGKGRVRGDIDLNQVVVKVTTIISHLIARHTNKFRLETTPGLPPVTGNMQQLEQVVINLILNAIQALPSPDRGLRVSTRFDSQSGNVCIEVADQGDGIPAEIAEKVMDPFFTTKLDSGGTGLGLSISQSIIRAHKGSLTFTSSHDQGTTFLVTLPATSKLRRGDIL